MRPLLAAALLLGCPPPEPTPSVALVVGRVAWDDTLPAAVPVAVGAATATPDARGVFRAEVAPGLLRVAVAPDEDQLGAVFDLPAPEGAESAAALWLAAPIEATWDPTAGPLTLDTTPPLTLASPETPGPVAVRAVVVDPADVRSLRLLPRPLPGAIAAGVRLDLGIQPAGGVRVALPLPAGRCDAGRVLTWDDGWVDLATAEIDGCVAAFTAPHLSDFVIVDDRPTVPLGGRVEDAAGAVVPGAAIQATAPDGYLGEAIADADGAFSLEVPVGAALELQASTWIGGMRWSTVAPVGPFAEPPDPVLITLAVERAGCDPTVAHDTEVHLALREDLGPVRNALGLVGSACALAPSEDMAFGHHDLVVYGWRTDAGFEARLEGPWDLHDASPGWRPPPAWVGDFGVQGATGPFASLTDPPPGGYHRERPVGSDAEIDWRFPLTAPLPSLYLRTRFGLYGRLQVLALQPTDDGLTATLRWQLEASGVPEIGP